MYEELVKRLKHTASLYFALPTEGGDLSLTRLLSEAVDAIEELSAHYCPNAIRNVHDRGDDSLCRVLGAEPPKEK